MPDGDRPGERGRTGVVSAGIAMSLQPPQAVPAQHLRQIEILARAAIKVALRCGMSKWRLAEIISAEYDVERNKQRSLP